MPFHSRLPPFPRSLAGTNMVLVSIIVFQFVDYIIIQNYVAHKKNSQETLAVCRFLLI